MSALWIVIPTLNRREALGRQLELLLEQARGARGRPAVIVVSDDGCDPPVSLPDDTKGDANVRLVRSDETLGPNLARDAAIRLSPPRAVIVEIDDHDLIEPGALRAVDRAFRAGAWLAYGDFLRVNSRGEPAPRDARTRKGPYRRYRFREEGALHVGLRAYRRCLYDEVGGYRPEEFPAGDYALMLRMESRLKGRRIVAIPRVLCRATTSVGGISVRLAEEQRRRALEYRRSIPDEAAEDFREPEPPDFSSVGERYTWLGRQGGAGLLDAREAILSDRKTLGRLTLSARKSSVVSSPEVSAIVPLFKSARYVRTCLTTLVQSLPQGSEIIAVDDASPDRSGRIAREVLAEMETGLLVTLSRNTGFAHATNVGARLSRGKHLLFFNADAVARPGFVEPMLHLMDEQPDVAIVGNRHVKPGGAVDSEGSEFCWHKRMYRHVGRDVPDPVVGAKDQVKERDMVTFACALVRRSCWDELSGLDERYVRAYFEDADLCMRARSRRWRVFYTRESEIIHVGRHARAGSHPHYRRNARLFAKRWVRTGLVDRFRRERGLGAHDDRVVVCMIACSEEEFVAASLESVYPLADRIVIVEGGTRFAVEAGLADELGRSTDRTVEEIESFTRHGDPDGKVKLIRAPGRPWRDKQEMRSRYAAELRPGDWMLLLDADEVFTEEGLWRMSALMHSADVICPSFHLFWNDMGTLGTGRWDEFRQLKAVRWREGWSYARDHNVPTDARGVHVTALSGVKVVRTPQRLYCHYSWAGRSDEKLARKCRHYVAQNGAKVFPPDYFERVFLAWRNNPGEIERAFGTHPYGGGGTARFALKHPEPVERRMREGRLPQARILLGAPA